MARRILLIEDDSDLYSLLKYNLEKEGFAFAGSQTGRGALDLCRRVRPDLVLLDIMLPDSDGLDICKGIRNDAQLAQTPIIFLTARASETDRIVGLELGANDYIVKPFFVREVIARIKLQFRGSGAPSRSRAAGLHGAAGNGDAGQRDRDTHVHDRASPLAPARWGRQAQFVRGRSGHRKRRRTANDTGRCDGAPCGSSTTRPLSASIRCI